MQVGSLNRLPRNERYLDIVRGGIGLRCNSRRKETEKGSPSADSSRYLSSHPLSPSCPSQLAS